VRPLHIETLFFKNTKISIFGGISKKLVVIFGGCLGLFEAMLGKNCCIDSG
jgi:hypothetical protein